MSAKQWGASIPFQDISKISGKSKRISSFFFHPCEHQKGLIKTAKDPVEFRAGCKNQTCENSEGILRNSINCSLQPKIRFRFLMFRYVSCLETKQVFKDQAQEFAMSHRLFWQDLAKGIWGTTWDPLWMPKNTGDMSTAPFQKNDLARSGRAPITSGGKQNNLTHEIMKFLDFSGFRGHGHLNNKQMVVVKPSTKTENSPAKIWTTAGGSSVYPTNKPWICAKHY